MSSYFLKSNNQGYSYNPGPGNFVSFYLCKKAVYSAEWWWKWAKGREKTKPLSKFNLITMYMYTFVHVYIFFLL